MGDRAIQFLASFSIASMLIFCILSLKVDVILDQPKPYRYQTQVNQSQRVEIKDQSAPTSRNWEFSDYCSGKGFIAIQNRGRLGNQLGIYATLYSLAKYYNMSPVLISIKQQDNLLSRSFPNLKIPIVKRKCEKNGQKLHPFDVKIRAIKLTDAIRKGNPTQINTTTKNVFLTDFPNTAIFFNRFRNELLGRDLLFYDKIVVKAKAFLQKALNKLDSKEARVFVGVHVRRNDYQKYMKTHYKRGGLYLSRQFFIDCMNYFREKFTNPLFIIASDDHAWCRRNLHFHDVVFTNIASPVLDLAILAHCHHSIISYGTFSFWSAYMKPSGTTLYYSYMKREGLNSSSSEWIPVDDPCHVLENGKWARSSSLTCLQEN